MTAARPRWWELGLPGDSTKVRAQRWVLTVRTKARWRALAAQIADGSYDARRALATQRR